tara:strand:- start:568 stop:753 length:186 start_codon:yes stop_codon:yes gene_type:complete
MKRPKRLKRLGQVSELKRDLVDKRHGANDESMKFSQKLVHKAERQQVPAIIAEQTDEVGAE